MENVRFSLSKVLDFFTSLIKPSALFATALATTVAALPSRAEAGATRDLNFQSAGDGIFNYTASVKPKTKTPYEQSMSFKGSVPTDIVLANPIPGIQTAHITLSNFSTVDGGHRANYSISASSCFAALTTGQQDKVFAATMSAINKGIVSLGKQYKVNPLTVDENKNPILMGKIVFAQNQAADSAYCGFAPVRAPSSSEIGSATPTSQLSIAPATSNTQPSAPTSSGTPIVLSDDPSAVAAREKLLGVTSAGPVDTATTATAAAAPAASAPANSHYIVLNPKAATTVASTPAASTAAPAPAKATEWAVRKVGTTIQMSLAGHTAPHFANNAVINPDGHVDFTLTAKSAKVTSAKITMTPGAAGLTFAVADIVSTARGDLASQQQLLTNWLNRGGGKAIVQDLNDGLKAKGFASIHATNLKVAGVHFADDTKIVVDQARPDPIVNPLSVQTIAHGLDFAPVHAAPSEFIAALDRVSHNQSRAAQARPAVRPETVIAPTTTTSDQDGGLNTLLPASLTATGTASSPQHTVVETQIVTVATTPATTPNTLVQTAPLTSANSQVNSNVIQLFAPANGSNSVLPSLITIRSADPLTSLLDFDPSVICQH